MKLSISNIAWGGEADQEMYRKIADMGYQAVEIAPSRIFGSTPYQKLSRARKWAYNLMDSFGLSVSSMQSIWYGREENLFQSSDERSMLAAYSAEAVQFAEAIACPNLVFGCPKNRAFQKNAVFSRQSGIDFLKMIGETASQHGTVFALEPNPIIYNTNYMNTLTEVLDVLSETGTKGLGLNLDLGAMLFNQEPMDLVYQCLPFIHHVHISEPGLAVIQRRQEHQRLLSILKEGKYQGYVSIEMSKCKSLDTIIEVMKYIKEVCQNVES